MRSRGGWLGTWLAWLALGPCIGCSSSPETGLYVVVESELGTPDPIDTLTLEVTGEGMVGSPALRTLPASEGPLRVLLTPRAGADPSAPVRLVAAARSGDTIVVSRRIETAFTAGRILVLEVRLTEWCRTAACPDECDGASCVAELVPPSTLPTWPELDAGARDAAIDASVLDAPSDAPSDASDASLDGGLPLVTCLPTPEPFLGETCPEAHALERCEGPYACDFDDVCRIIEDVDTLTAGPDHTCAFRRAGSSVVCWGEASRGRLGAPAAVANPSVPGTAVVRVPGIVDATSVGAGDDFTCAVLSGSGRIRCWGATAASWAAPCASGFVELALPGGERADAVDAGDGYACAVGTGGGVFCWGEGEGGELGGLASSSTPVAVAGPHDVRELTVGAHHACALGDAGLWCWGRNDDGELGAGDTAPHDGAVEITAIEDARAIAAGDRHTCALLGAGSGTRLACWGADDRGQLDGTSGGARSLAPMERAAPDADALVLGVDHGCTRHGDVVRCWGACDAGACGPTPGEALPESEPYVAVAAGRAHTCMLGTGGWCIGSNDRGQLGEPPVGATPPFRVQGFR